VLDAVRGIGALAIGFDLIFPTTVESFIPNFDQKFLLAIKSASAEGRIVLAKAFFGDKPLAPHAAQSFAVGHVRNIRSVNLDLDSDGVIRRAPLFFDRRGTNAQEPVETSFALELAARAAGFTPFLDQDGLTFGAAHIAGSAGGSILLNFDGGAQSVPTYSFADIAGCAQLNQAEFFKTAFAGKVVLIGSVLDVEDRKVTSARFIGGKQVGAETPRCAVKPIDLGERQTIARQTIPGVFVHATAINNLLRNESLVTPGRVLSGLILLAAGLVAGSLAQTRRWGRGALWLVAGLLGWAILAVGLAQSDVILPLIDAPIVAVIGFLVPAGIRFAITDRERIQVRRAFSYYLAPEALVRTMNVYLGAMTEAIEAHGGFVDKYIGDAIVAVFGAPHDDPDHARNATKAALACQALLPTLAPALGLPPGRTLRARIGLNTGRALVGNIGSKRRFNYTVMGDAVNLASRLEGANKVYGRTILASAETRTSSADTPPFREIDRVIVKGRAGATAIYEPLPKEGGPSAETLTAFSLALADYRAGRFAEAAERFAALAAIDPSSRALEARCRRFIAAPPPAPWSGITPLESK